MTITRQQVADLREGDVVEYHRAEWPEGAIVRAPLERSDFDNMLYVLGGHFGVVDDNGTPYEPDSSLTVVSRAPRPLYVNHPRTEPVAGDVVRDASTDDPATWHFLTRPGGPWYDLRGNGKDRAVLPARLRLLVDGETGQVVPS